MNLDKITKAYESGKLNGIFKDVPIDVYHNFECPGFSSTFLKNTLRHSFGHASDWRKEKQSKSDSLLVGSAFHDLLLQPHIFSTNWAVVPEGMRKDKRSKEYQAFLMDNNGKEALTQDQFNTIAKMAENTRKNPNFAELDGIIEGTCWWTDQETELPLKCRPDILTNKGIMVDLKSTSDARSWAFSKSIHEYMYHLSAAMYLDGVRANGIEANEFHLIAVENKYPYAVAWYRLDAASLDKGYELYKKALWKIKEGLTDESPTYYSDEIQDISLPSYGWTE